MAETVSGLVLAAASSSEPQAIPGLPGLWSTDPAFSVVASDLGLSIEELREKAEDLGIEVEEVEWERAITKDGKELSVPQIRERISDLDDDELSILAGDERKAAASAAKKEIARRAESASGGLVGAVGAEVGGSGLAGGAPVTTALTPGSPPPAIPTTGGAP